MGVIMIHNGSDDSHHQCYQVIIGGPWSCCQVKDNNDDAHRNHAGMPALVTK